MSLIFRNEISILGGEMESTIIIHTIFYDSPMASGLLRKQVDDEVEVMTPLDKSSGLSTRLFMKNLKF